jgi:xylulokinase
MAYLGLDIGTTTCKASVINPQGRVIASAKAEYDLIMPRPGHIELNGALIWESTKGVLKSAVQQSPERIDAISIASFGEAFVPLDKNGNVLDNSIIFSDIRGTDEVKDILEKISEADLYGIAGLPMNTIYSLNKLLWIKKNKPHVYRNAEMLLLYCDFIFYKLSGERKLDCSLASRTMLLDVQTRQWSDTLLGLFDIDKDKLSQPVPAGSVVGHVSAPVASELVLGDHVMLVAGSHDQVCAALGAGVLNKGDSVDGIGTVECLTVILNNLDHLDVMRKNNFCIEPYVLPDEYVTLAFSNTAGAVLKWYRNTIERERYLEAEKHGKSIYEIMERECPDAPTDLLLMPHFAGSGTPYMDPNSCGALLGLKLSTTKGDIYKACLEGISFEMMLNAELLNQCGNRIESITCAGGGTDSKMLMQIKADIMGMPVKRLKVQESGTIALGMLCAVACGDYKTLHDAAKAFVHIDAEFQPDREKHKIYQDKYQAYKRMYAAVKQTGM